ncbi:hypothetical protein SAMN05421761_105209 [Belliella pelovolcani]|uniref:Uncharacterized protein n=2 Tax=Belliella pelovolcani TaxID=529505 RepID=A0A1N7M9D9_9BACT|nr:hypothetical protein SAMN05421761_105209 [Belliella pelovolcani]
MQPFYLNPYLSGMNSRQKQIQRSERLKWGLAFLICMLTAALFSYEPTEKSLFDRISNPISFLKMEQENQFHHIITKFFNPEIPDKFKRL